MKTFTKFFNPIFALIVLLSYTANVNGQELPKSNYSEHNLINPEQRYLQLQRDYILGLEPINLQKNVNLKKSSEYTALLDTAYVYSVALNPQRTIYSYTEQGFRTYTLSQIEQSGNWVNMALETCTYDDFGNVLTSFWRAWNDGAWENSSKVTSTYNDNFNLLTFLDQYWENGDWVNATTGEYIYNDYGNVVWFQQNVWSNDEWANYSTELYTYDDDENLILVTTQQWNETYWYNHLQYTFTHDANNNVITVLTEYWEDATWKNSSLQTYTYNDINYRTLFVSETWENETWVYNNKYTYQYNALDFVEIVISETWESDAWANVQKINYAYASFGNVESSIVELWENAEWINSSLKHYYYDELGNAIEGNYYAWDGVAWMQFMDGLITINYNYSTYSDYFLGYKVYAHYYSIPVGIDETQIYNIESFVCNPNPATNFTTLSFNLNKKSNVEISVYNLVGEKIASVYSGSLPMGKHTYTIETNKLSSGTYIVCLNTENNNETTKIVIIK